MVGFVVGRTVGDDEDEPDKKKKTHSQDSGAQAGGSHQEGPSGEQEGLQEAPEPDREGAEAERLGLKWARLRVLGKDVLRNP